MDEQTRHNQEILFSRTVKAGKRLYYIDVKSSRSGDLYLSLTESKKVNSGDADCPSVNYEKHKIFLYKEDFEKFTTALAEGIAYAEDHQGKADPREEQESDEIRIDVEF